MIQVQSFEFSPFSENTYVLFDETSEAVIIDPGCLSSDERQILKDFIESNSLKIKSLLQTHCHLDHVFGSAWVKRTFGVEMYIHKNDIPILNDVEARCNLWGIKGYEPVIADKYLAEGDKVKFGNSELDVVFVPGHCPGHIAFICHKDKFIMGGDCLFYRSIGRTDFPFCSQTELINSIKTKFFTLPDDYIVYAGHMQHTTIGDEKHNNPFLK